MQRLKLTTPGVGPGWTMLQLACTLYSTEGQKSLPIVHFVCSLSSNVTIFVYTKKDNKCYIVTKEENWIHPLIKFNLIFDNTVNTVHNGFMTLKIQWKQITSRPTLLDSDLNILVELCGECHTQGSHHPTQHRSLP